MARQLRLEYPSALFNPPCEAASSNTFFMTTPTGSICCGCSDRKSCNGLVLLCLLSDEQPLSEEFISPLARSATGECALRTN
jgi:hypothetical protein